MTFPTLPDNYVKYQFLVMFIFFGFGYYIFSQTKEIRDSSSQDLQAAQDTFSLRQLEVSHRKNVLVKTSALLSERYSFVNPIKEKDSILVFELPVFLNSTYSSKIIDSIATLWNNCKEMDFDLVILDSKVKIANRKLTEAKAHFSRSRWGFIILSVLGLIVLSRALAIIIKQQRMQDKLLSIELSNNSLPKENCQSCGRIYSYRLKKGSDVNGDENLDFCRDCFTEGQFTEPELTLKELQKRLKVDHAGPNRRQQAARLKNYLSKLSRWSGDYPTDL